MDRSWRPSALATLPFAVAVVACGAAALPAPPRPPAADRGALRPVASFARIADAKARSRALFLETTKVLLHPRCANCHPADDSPRQGETSMLHDPPVARGPGDRGVPALECTSCHQAHNLADARVPGAPEWHLAPRSMAWLGRSPAALCAQLKDRERNGGRTLAAVAEHMAHDPLVAWGWDPGHGREPAPGSQAALAALVQAWIDTGAECPPETAERTR